MILHLCVLEKFVDPFYEFLEEHFDDFDRRHVFYINDRREGYKRPQGNNVFLARSFNLISRYIWLSNKMHRADKIILHGLWDYRILLALSLQPWILKKCYWMIWGGDLYTYEMSQRNMVWWSRELLRRHVIKRIGHFITHIKGDYELARLWYDAKGTWHECFMYPSNLYQAPKKNTMPHDGINILIGNSADPSNNHKEMLGRLRAYSNSNIRIYCPLNYGDLKYAEEIEEYGKSIFCEKFIALRDFMSFNEYLDFLVMMDVAIFNHRRQQGMGTTTALLGMGKKVYMRKDVTSYAMFEDLGITVYPIESFNIDDAGKNNLASNSEIVKNYFSVEQLELMWMKIYG